MIVKNTPASTRMSRPRGVTEMGELVDNLGGLDALPIATGVRKKSNALLAWIWICCDYCI